MRARVQKWGNSLGLRIPRAVAAAVDVEEGALVELSVADGTRLVCPVQPAYVLRDLVEGITPRNRHREVASGRAAGREAW